MRPGGNPELKKHQFSQKYDWGKSCKAQVALRIPQDWKDRLYAVDGWQEKLRETIAELIEENPIAEAEGEKN